MPDFEEFKKIPRVFRDAVITEKIDGTNGQILIERRPKSSVVSWTGVPLMPISDDGLAPLVAIEDGDDYIYVWAGSRNRWVYPGKDRDNNGFASWVASRAEGLVRTLGEGRHYGEWWGQGIQRGYGLQEKRFSLFNTSRWNEETLQGAPLGLGVVPLLYEGLFATEAIQDRLAWLKENGSVCSPGFMRPEGVVVYHVAANAYFKATIENDEAPKSKTKDAA